MKRAISLLLCIALAFTFAVSFAGCGKSKSVTIAVPNDPTNEARALQLLEKQGLIKLKETGKNDKGEDILATVRDIEENPYNIEFKEMEAAQVPNVLKDVDLAVINSNYAIPAGLSPLITEGTDVAYPNIIAVKEGNEKTDKTKALIAAISSKEVKEYIEKTYAGAVVCDLENITDGYDSTVNYDALKGQKIIVAASPTPHADILKIAKEILAKKGVALEISEQTDYIIPNTVVEDGDADANYFQHIPYLESFNKENGTHLVSVLKVHHEPMGIYAGKAASIDEVKSK